MRGSFGDHPCAFRNAVTVNPFTIDTIRKSMADKRACKCGMTKKPAMPSGSAQQRFQKLKKLETRMKRFQDLLSIGLVFRNASINAVSCLKRSFPKTSTGMIIAAMTGTTRVHSTRSISPPRLIPDSITVMRTTSPSIA
ncbi:hypothetical protein [Prevotella corporis]|uniref:hypothetical protein n=1 Tax=Prevotella corporis TaxID=28128 RepID=UPI0012DD8C1E|nr:hypothetical protein [Prevotella corporis]